MPSTIPPSTLSTPNPVQSAIAFPSDLPLVACVQLNSQADIDANMCIVENSLYRAKQVDAKLVVLPENALLMGNQHSLAERFEEVRSWYAQLASQLELTIVAGTLPCPYRSCGTPVPNGKLRQSSLAFAPDGTCIARYDKIHLFRAQVNDAQGSYDEARTFEAGDKLVIADVDLGRAAPVRLGMMVCFDLRFPALAQQLRCEGAELLCAPSAFTHVTGQAHWSLLLKARALDAQCLMLGAAQGGRHEYPDGTVRETWGHASIMDANGRCLAQYPHTDLPANSSSEQGVNHEEGFTLVTAPFDGTSQQTLRQRLPLAECHRLPL